MLDAFAHSDSFQDVRHLILPVRRRDHRDVMADGLVGRIAQNPLSAGVPAPNDAVEVLTDDGVIGGFDNGGETRFQRGRAGIFGGGAVISNDAKIASESPKLEWHVR